MPVPYNDWLATLTRKADLRSRAGLSRSAAPRAAAIDLAGNDYLGLSRHPLVVAAAASALSEFGLGATGSRLVRGTTSLHAQLEEALARYMGTPSALVYSSGYLANLGAIRALASLSRDTLLVADAHCHASMIDGCRLSGAEVAVFRHGDASHAASLLSRDRRCVILTESVFSVDGDLAPLASLHSAAREAGALLLVDDAHGLGVGSFVANLAAEPDVIITATLSKSLGGAGGVVGGPPEFIRHLVDTSRTFIFDTALPPAVAAGVLAALDIARSPSSDPLRTELHRRAALLAALTTATAAPPSPSALSPSALSPSALSPSALPPSAAADHDHHNFPEDAQILDPKAATSRKLRRSWAGRAGETGRAGGASGAEGERAEASGAEASGLSGAGASGLGGAEASGLSGAGGAVEGKGPAGGVVSLLAPSAAAAYEWASRCRDKGVAVGCFRPPSTPDSRSRLRLTVNAGVPLADFEHALEVIEQCRPSAE